MFDTRNDSLSNSVVSGFQFTSSHFFKPRQLMNLGSSTYQNRSHPVLLYVTGRAVFDSAAGTMASSREEQEEQKKKAFVWYTLQSSAFLDLCKSVVYGIRFFWSWFTRVSGRNSLSANHQSGTRRWQTVGNGWLVVQFISISITSYQGPEALRKL